MSKTTLGFILIFAIAIASGPVIGFGIIGWMNSMEKPQSPFGSSQSQFVRDQGGAVVSGFSVGDGFTISWKSESDPNGADTLEVIAVTLERLRHLQKTNTGGNDFARAIWNLEKALDALKAPAPSNGGGFISPTEKTENDK